jgi:hypothetical protein
MEIDPTTLNTFLAALTAFILAIIAWLNKQRTDIAKTAQNNATAVTVAPAFVPIPGVTTGFFEVRDGRKILNGLDGWYARINPSPQAATLPDDKCWQAVSAKGAFYSGDKDTIVYLITHADAAGWRSRNA